MTRAFEPVPGFPALVKPDGSFAAKGSRSWDTFKYDGKLRLHGTSKGYLSLFHTEVKILDGGRLGSDTCFDAKNWTVRRSSR
jgi:hypothetical protein